MITVFEQELEKGTGVPYLLLKKGCIQPSEQIEEILYANIIENKAYDPQCEGSRTEYMYDLLELYPHREKIDERVIAYFNTMDDRDWGELQVFGFVRKLAESRRFDKTELYKKFEQYAEEDMYNGMIGLSDLLLLDKYEAVVYLARYFGTHITEDNKKEFIDSTFYAIYAEDIGYTEAELTEKLRNEHDAAIDRYLAIAHIKRKTRRKKQKQYTADTAIALLKRKASPTRLERISLRRWVRRRASEADIQKLSNVFLEAELPLKKRLIRLFDERQIKIPAQVLFDSFEATENKSFRQDIIEALVPFNDPAVYDFLKDRYDDNTRNAFIKVCFKYYSENKKTELFNLLELCTIFDIHEIKHTALESKALAEDPVFNDILRILYRNMKCPLCRNRIVEKMIERRCIDDNLYEEIQYDVDPDTRALARRER
jgi:hypothetical protein